MVFSWGDLHSLWEQSNDAHTRSEVRQESNHRDNKEDDMFLERVPIKRIVGVARRLWNQNGLAITSGLQPLSFRPELLDIEYMGAGVGGRAGRVKLRALTLITMDRDSIVWNALQVARDRHDGPIERLKKDEGDRCSKRLVNEGRLSETPFSPPTRKAAYAATLFRAPMRPLVFRRYI